MSEPQAEYITDALEMRELSYIPSPYEVEEKKTINGGWCKHDLISWGVPWPPPNGWKEELEKAYKAGLTVGVILECIGCRLAKYFADYEDYPVCGECEKLEQEKYKKEHEIEQIHSVRSRVVSMFQPRPKKELIPNELRWAVFERDNFTCQHCGSRRNLSVDHIIPESKGGKLTMENTQTLCKSCNSRKGAR